MVFLYVNSYVLDSNYKPENIEELQKLLVINKEKNMVEFKDKFLVSKVNDSIIKLGFMLLARDCIKKVESPSNIPSVWINYNINNFIFDSKSFLDSIAVLLNYFYKLSFEGGSIDLQKVRFVSDLEQKNKELAKFIQKNQMWINKVTEWRMKLIHRHSLMIVPVAELGENPSDEHITKMNQKAPIMMPVEPLAVFELDKKTIDELKDKHGDMFQAIIPFCDEWISNAKSVLETICYFVATDFRLKSDS